jgi:hypothetical protein
MVTGLMNEPESEEKIFLMHPLYFSIQHAVLISKKYQLSILRISQKVTKQKKERHGFSDFIIKLKS